MSKAHEELGADRRRSERLIRLRNGPIPQVVRANFKKIDQLLLITCGVDVSFTLH